MSIGPDLLGKMFPFGSGIAPVIAELVVTFRPLAKRARNPDFGCIASAGLRIS